VENVAMTIHEILEQIPHLSVPERKHLIMRLVDSLTIPEPEKTHSLDELRGLGAEIWQGVDVEEYINQMRDAWDEPA
jgi:hypothetical protein